MFLDELQLTTHPRYLTLCVFSPQVGGCADRMHEEQGVGQVLPRAPGISEALFASGLLPAQASAEDPQVPPTAARASVCLSLHTHNCFIIHINTSAGTCICVRSIVMFFMYTTTIGCAWSSAAFLNQ